MTILQLGKGSGLPFPWDGESAETRRLYTLWAILIELFMLYKIVCACFAFGAYPNIQEFVYGTACSLFQLFGFLLTLFYAARRQGFERLLRRMDSISDDFTRSKLGVHEFFENVYYKDAKNISKLSKILTPYSALTPFINASSVVIVGLYNNKYREHLLVLNKCPYETLEPGIYEYLIVQQFLGYLFPCLQKLSHECIMLGLFKIQSAYFKSLSKSMDMLSEEMESGTVHDLGTIKIWISLHQQVLQNAEELIEFFSPLILIYYITFITTEAGIIIYLINGEGANLFQTIFVGIYMFITIWYMYMQCHAGEEITTQASLLADAVYNLPWYKANSETNGIIKLIINMANRPLTVMAYKSNSFRLCREAFQSLFLSTVSAYMAFTKIIDISDHRE